jgi:ribonucleotide reductase alpha subunit
MKILNKKDLNEIDKAFDVNSLQVLAARYLLRDNNNEIDQEANIRVLKAVVDVGKRVRKDATGRCEFCTSPYLLPVSL